MNQKRKQEQYERIYNQLKEIFESKTLDEIAKMAAIAALLKHKISTFYWCGFYRYINNELMVGPYQGFLACSILKKNTGVCWASFQKRQTVIVPDVTLYEGHIACDSRSLSEIVVPVFMKNNIIGVLDVDSDKKNSFDSIDQEGLEKIVTLF